MQYLKYICLFLWGPLLMNAQSIPPERTVDWSVAGVASAIPPPTQSIDAVEQGADPTGLIPVDAVMTQMLEETKGAEQTELYFPPGRYLFHRRIDLHSNITLRGAGPDSTVFLLDMESAWNAIRCIGEREDDSYFLSDSAMKGDSLLYFDLDSMPWRGGDYLYLYDDDVDKVVSSWAEHSTGQLARIVAVRDSSIELNQPLRRNYLLSDHPRAERIAPVRNVKIDQLKLKRQDQADQQTSNVLFRYATNCAVECIESDRCHFAHIDLSYSSHISVRGSYFHNAHDFGGGGRGYGLVVQYGTGSSLVTDNIFDSLRHAMLLQAGANGNVVSYNYSQRPYWTSFPPDAAGDLVLHGNYPYANLLEGNVVQNIIIDASHDINGPFNTFFRNRAEDYGLVMSGNPASDRQNFVGNEISGTGFLKGNFTLFGTDHFSYGNNDNGSLIPPGTGDLSRPSLYIDTVRSWYMQNMHWPPIGPPRALEEYTNRAAYRFEEERLTSCSGIMSTSVVGPSNFENTLKIAPNPATSSFKIKKPATFHRGGLEIKIINSVGEIKYSGSWKPYFSVKGWPAGVYFIQLRTEKGNVFGNKVIVF